MSPRNILVVAAHPDDEYLGCGGTLLRHVANGDHVHIMILAEGLTSRDQHRDVDRRKGELSALHHSSQMAADLLGADSLRLCSFPDNRMDSVDLLDVVKCVEEQIESLNPSIIYTHHAGDVNVDHLITHKAVITAARSLPGSRVERLIFFETVSSTEWQIQNAKDAFFPNWFVQIDEFIDKKIALLRCYDSEMKAYPHPRSYDGVEYLARYRGQIVGVKYAEAFSLGRNILREGSTML
jgi:putative lmbE-like protein